MLADLGMHCLCTFCELIKYIGCSVFPNIEVAASVDPDEAALMCWLIWVCTVCVHVCILIEYKFYIIFHIVLAHQYGALLSNVAVVTSVRYR